MAGVADLFLGQEDLAWLRRVAATLAAGESLVNSLSPDSHQPGADGHQWLATIPPAIRTRLPATGANPRRKVMRALILELCALQALSAGDLAAALNRTEHKP